MPHRRIPRAADRARARRLIGPFFRGSRGNARPARPRPSRRPRARAAPLCAAPQEMADEPAGEALSRIGDLLGLVAPPVPFTHELPKPLGEDLGLVLAQRERVDPVLHGVRQDAEPHEGQILDLAAERAPLPLERVFLVASRGGLESRPIELPRAGERFVDEREHLGPIGARELVADGPHEHEVEQRLLFTRVDCLEHGRDVFRHGRLDEGERDARIGGDEEIGVELSQHRSELALPRGLPFLEELAGRVTQFHVALASFPASGPMSWGTTSEHPRAGDRRKVNQVRRLLFRDVLVNELVRRAARAANGSPGDTCNGASIERSAQKWSRVTETEAHAQSEKLMPEGSQTRVLRAHWRPSRARSSRAMYRRASPWCRPFAFAPAEPGSSEATTSADRGAIFKNSSPRRYAPFQFPTFVCPCEGWSGTVLAPP